MGITIQSKVTTTKIIFKVDDAKTGVITLVDGKYNERPELAFKMPESWSREWFDLVRDIDALIKESEANNHQTSNEDFEKMLRARGVDFIDIASPSIRESLSNSEV